MTITSTKTRRKATVAQFLEAVINTHDKSQQEIADEVGFNKPTMISMIKLGKAKVPLNKARLLARSLGIDETDFFYRCFEEYLPEIYEELVDIEDNNLALTKSETEIIKRIRDERPDHAGITNDKQSAALDAFIETLPKL